MRGMSCVIMFSLFLMVIFSTHSLGSVYEKRVEHATFEADNPSYLFLNDTAYINPAGFFSVLIDTSGSGFSDIAWASKWGPSLYGNLIAGVGGGEGIVGTYGLKYKFLDESSWFATVSMGLRGGASETEKLGYDPSTGTTYRMGVEKTSEITYKLIVSKKAGDGHWHLGLDIFNGSGVDVDGISRKWDSHRMYAGYDATLWNFRPMLEAWYDPPRDIRETCFSMRFPAMGGVMLFGGTLQFQIGFINLDSLKTNENSSSTVIGFYFI